jgi:hypothetical protein
MKSTAFGTKASAMALLRSEFLIPEGEIKLTLLDRCVAAGGNQYDVAVQYAIARARSIGIASERVERVLTQDLYIAEQLSAFCSSPDTMRKRVQETRDERQNALRIGRN